MEYGFMPDPAIATRLHHQFSSQLCASFEALRTDLEQADPVLASDPNWSALASIPNTDLTGLHCFAYHAMLDLLEHDRTSEAAKLLEVAANIPRNDSRLIAAADIDRGLASLIFAQISAGTTHKAIRICSIPRPRELMAWGSTCDGLKKLREVLPDLCAEIDALVHGVIFFDSIGNTDERALSFTGSRLQSLILINGTLDTNWIFLLDKMVHESAHAYLFAINLQEEMVLNTEGAVYSSPLRRDARDMNAIYHATFVLQRLILAFSTMLDRGDFDATDRNRMTKLLRHYLDRVGHGYATVMRHGQLSTLARHLIDEGQDAVMRIRQHTSDCGLPH